VTELDTTFVHLRLLPREIDRYVPDAKPHSDGAVFLLVNGRSFPRPITMTVGDTNRLRIVSIHSDELLELVGLGERAQHRPYELSGGEQQRVAIARSLANRPDLLLADEPTGQLDSQTGHGIMALVRAIVRGEGTTGIVATHDPALIGLADRVIELKDGRIV